ncbi:ThuA domain-containing protein [Segetibacter aerophilus]|uniref:Crp/Fnr family transcriptional regulator n=1 Tax=Segetibacter aerophilus TaxID=670293 RepID=A0A512BDN9_9BACT|nr:ThuA domain-containing protein [Segetibacter aerophilus]GEO10078.1 Crp/Fnr family transcriptional regulator [Segetibacter aerophilus]
MKRLSAIIVFICFLVTSACSLHAQGVVNWKNVRVLVYTKNGKGYVHDNIPSAVSCIQKLGQQHGFKVDTSRDASVMTENNLKQYSLLIFPSTNNDVFDTDEQRLAFRRYIEAGGGFVGLHSVTGTERNWKWFKMMMGGTFSWHAKFQKFKEQVITSSHPSMRGLPKVWEKEDECYFAKELYPGPRVLMAHNITSLNLTDTAQKNLVDKNAGGYADLYPSVWYYDFDGGHTWCTVLGHDKKDYSDPVYVKHIFQGIEYVAGQVKSRDFSKAYADSRDTPVRF